MNAESEEEADKRHEVMCHIVADNVVRQLIETGVPTGRLIDFASEVVRSVTERGVGGNNLPGDHAGDQGRVQPILWRVEPAGALAPRIRGERVWLRPLAADDGPLLARWRQDEEIQRTFSKALLSYLIDHLSDAPADPARRDFIVCEQAGKPIGLVCLQNIDMTVGQAEMAKLLGDPADRGKGYAKEASCLLLAYAIDILKLRRIYLRAAGFSMHNIKLNEKLGFRFEGILRHSEILDGCPVHVVLMSMLVEEFTQRYRLQHLDGGQAAR